MNYFQAMTDFIYGVRDIGKVNVLRLIADIDVVMKREFSAPQSAIERRLMLLVTVPVELPRIWVYA